MNVAALIGISIAMVVGVNLIPVVSDTIATLNTATAGSAVVNLMKLLPIVFVAILIIGAVSYIAWGRQ